MEAKEKSIPPAPFLKGEIAGETVKKRKIKIHQDSHDPKSTHVPVSVNGVTNLIKRGEVVELDVSYIEALEHAVNETYSQDESGNLIPRQSLAYPFSYMD